MINFNLVETIPSTFHTIIPSVSVMGRKVKITFREYTYVYEADEDFTVTKIHEFTWKLNKFLTGDKWLVLVEDYEARKLYVFRPAYAFVRDWNPIHNYYSFSHGYEPRLDEVTFENYLEEKNVLIMATKNTDTTILVD